jgi:hypothetical protein
LEKKLKHLEFIQLVISRMAMNSFLLKGWTLTITTAFIAFFADKNLNFFVVYFPVILFWFLDAYFLWQEKLFRHLYDEVREQKENEINFSMKIKPKKENFLNVFTSITLVLFYLGVIATIILLFFIL